MKAMAAIHAATRNTSAMNWANLTKPEKSEGALSLFLAAGDSPLRIHTLRSSY